MEGLATVRLIPDDHYKTKLPEINLSALTERYMGHVNTDIQAKL